MSARMVRCPTCGTPRTVISEKPKAIEPIALAVLAADLDGCPDGCWRFFTTIFAGDLSVRTARRVAHTLAVSETTLMSRFGRAGLPSPKAYLAAARIVRAAGRMEDARQSFSDVAFSMMENSSQSFSRCIRERTGRTPRQLRQTETGTSMLAWFRETYVLPHVDTLRRFDPLTAVSGRTGPRPRMERVA